MNLQLKVLFISKNIYKNYFEQYSLWNKRLLQLDSSHKIRTIWVKKE